MSEFTGAVRAGSVGVEGDAELLAQADELDRAADELLMRGRCRGNITDAQDRVCLLGAIGAARGLDLKELQRDYTPLFGDPVVSALASYITDGEGHGMCATFIWNDARERTEDEVHDALRGCAKHLRERAARAPVAGRVGGGAEGREEVG